MKKMLPFLFIFCMNFLQAQVANQPGNLEVCDDNTDGIFCFDLTFQIPQILGSQNPFDYNVSFHASQADADFGLNPLNPTPYCNTASVETIFVRVEDASNSALFDTTSFDLIVNVPPSLVQAVPLGVCDDDFDQIATFDLTSKEAEILGGQTGITLQYYANPQDLTNNVPIANPTMYQNVQTGVQTIFVRATATLSGCENTVTFNIRVLPTPFPNQNPTPIEVCDDDTDGIVFVDITVRNDEIILAPDIVINYYNSQADAEFGQNAIPNPFTYLVDVANANANGEVIIYVRVESSINFDSNNEPCYAVVELPIIINSLPVLTSSSYSYVFCEFDNDNIGQFNWDDVTAVLNLVQAPQNINDFTVSYHSTIGDAINNVGTLANGYENFTDPQTVYIRVENTATGCFNANNIASLTLQVEPVPTATQPSLYEVCAEDASNQNISIFDLSTLNSTIIGGQSNVDVVYYETAADATNTTNALTNPSTYFNSSNPETVYARTRNVFTGCYSSLVSVGLQVNPLPVVTLPEDTFVCVDSNTGLLFEPFSIGTDLGPGISYQWSTPNGIFNTPTVTVTFPGTYSLNVTDFNSSNSCGYFDSVTFTGEFAPCSLSVGETSLNAFTIYPNPVQSELIVTSETNLHIESLAIYSLEGKRIRQQTSDFDQDQIRINVAEVKAGFYILKIQTVDNKILTKRFIVE